MNLSKSIDFLLDNAGPVIQYRLKKEILGGLSQKDNDNILEQIYKTPLFTLLKSYVKPSGYIGSGMHSWDNWRGLTLHETPLQDGEAAARLLSYYAIPKEHPIVMDFASVLCDEEKLRMEFSYIPPEIERFNNRFRGINSGYCLMNLVYAMLAMLGYGDDNFALPHQDISLRAFKNILSISSLDEITKTRKSKAKYNYPFIDEDTYFPCQYHLETLAYSKAWRTQANIEMLADSLNHFNVLMQGENPIHVKIKSKYCVPFPLNMGNSPIRAFRTDVISNITYRRLLTEIAMLGVGEAVNVLNESIENIKKALDEDGILRQQFNVPHNKRYSPKKIEYPTPYEDVRLEPDYTRKYALECDLTFWAVQLCFLVNGSLL